MNADSATPARWRLVEIWGDTADQGHLAWSIVIGVAVSLTGYLVASRVLASVVSTPELARLGGCVVSGLICAKLFTPKREVVEGTDPDPRWREEVLAELAGERGDLGSVDDLPPSVVREMKELEIYDLFASYKPRARNTEGAAS